LKRGLLEKETAEYIVSVMSFLNRTAADVASEFSVNACTDVTGFGLLGHLKEMSVASGCNVNIGYSSIPWIREAKNLAAAGVIPGGTYNNLDFVNPLVDFGKLPRTGRLMLCDAQTSGGLLIALPEKQTAKLLSALHNAGLKDASVIGSFTKEGSGLITVIN